MMFNIKNFTVLTIFILLGVLFSIFAHYYLDQQEKTASVILKSINTQISETAYTISKSINSVKEAVSSRPLLDRVAANSEFISAAIMHDEQNIILTTDPHHRTIVSSNALYNHEATAYKQLMDKKAIETNIRFYEEGEAKIIKLLFIIDEEEVALYFNKKQFDFILYFFAAPFLSLLFIWLLMSRYVVKPLETLRQFAYYQNNIPKAFKLRELEVIRYSMVQTFQRLENEKKELYDMARKDSLSGLANRNALNEYLNRLIATSSRDGKEFALLFLDLDHFKTVNDSLGHNVGDELLKNISSIINEVLRTNDFIARVGGDEFVIVLQEYSSLLELTKVIDRIQQQLSKTMVVQTNPITISSSVGIAFYPKDGKDMVSLMKHSDIAMYEAKQKGRARYHFFTQELNAKVQNTIKLDKEMRKALRNGEYQLYYQPKVDINSGTLVSAEALIRWINPTKGMVAPDVFIPLAEENGFIVELGWWVVNEAIEQHCDWRDKGIDMPISINISTKQLLSDGFGKNFIDLLKEKEVNPAKIDIEITEYMFLHQSENNSRILHELHDYGITISLDDFGKGYSSLSYLKKFPIDNLKIDKSFMDDYATDEGSIFVDTIVKMGQTLNMKVIAEGVELKEQVDYLKMIGCNQYQGYYFSKPLSVDNFEILYFKSV